MVSAHINSHIIISMTYRKQSLEQNDNEIQMHVLTVSLTFISAPFSVRNSTISNWLLDVALCKGVWLYYNKIHIISKRLINNIYTSASFICT